MPAVPPPQAPVAGNQSVGPKQIYDELIRQGAGTIRAIGIMANMINESSLNVETGRGGTAIDSNGYPVYGLVSWNTASYPNAGQLVTGNPEKDLRAQITYLAQTGGFDAAKGSTYAESAGNFAANYEKCQGCQPGGQQYGGRQANASTVAGWVSAGDWPASAAQGSGQAQVSTSAQTQQSASCAWRIGNLDFFFFHTPSLCILSKTQARAVISAGIIVAGSVVGLLALGLLASQTSAGRAALSLATKAPGLGAVAAA